MNLKEKLNNNHPILLDGSMGAILIKKNLGGAKSHRINTENPDILTQIHTAYYEAGCDVVLTNTFNITPESMAKAGLTIKETVSGAVKAALKAKEAYPDRFVALNLGPTGRIFQPIGKSPFDEAYDHYAHQINAAGSQIDLIVIETISDLTEMRAAISASKDLTDVPVFAAMTFTAKERTWLGTTLKQWAELSETSSADAVGINCTLTPEEMLPIIQKFKTLTTKPIFAEPNRGQPRITKDATIYEMPAKFFADGVLKIFDAGIPIVGGCCGSDAECMHLIYDGIQNRLS